MAKLDPFIEALYEHNASRLIVAANEPVALKFGEESRPVTNAPLRPDVVNALVAEIAPADARARLVSNGTVSFTYSAPAGAVTISGQRLSEGTRFEVVPAKASAVEASAVEASAVAGPAGERADEPGASPSNIVSFPGVSEGGAPVGDDEDDGSVVRPSAQTAAMDVLFRELFEGGCSDLHLSAGNPPLFRKDGSIVTMTETDPLPPRKVAELLASITPERHQQEFDEKHDADFSYELPGLARFRCNVFRDRNGAGGVFRVIPNKTPTAEDLRLSPYILRLCMLTKGLVVVTGPTGSGKSTTLAAMIDYVNRNRTDHIITIEDPIEFVHPNKKCLINQREVGNHTVGFKPALRAALREDPDIVLVGEMRDLETVEIAIETAETGHLVFGTLHTNTAASTVDRIIDQFPAGRQNQIRSMLASSLKGVIAQTLCKRKAGGRVAALEVLIVNAAVANLIREGKTFQIASIMQTGAKVGMATLNDALMKVVKDDVVAADQAYLKAVDKPEFQKLLERNGVRLSLPAGVD